MSDQGEIVTYADMMEDAFYRLVDKYNINLEDKNIANKLDVVFRNIYKLVFEPGPDFIKHNHQRSVLIYYNVLEIEEIVNKYIDLCQLYNTLPKLNVFSNMTGINYYTINLWHKSNNTNKYIFTLNNDSIKDLENDSNNIIILSGNEGSNNIYNNIGYVNNSIYGNKSVSEDIKILTLKRFDIYKKIREAAQNFTRNNLQGSPVGAMASANNDEEVGLLWEPKKVLLKAEAERIALSAGDVASKYGIDISK